jgi:hypothetical protein
VTGGNLPDQPTALVRFAALKSSHLHFESLAQQPGAQDWTRSPAQHAAADQEPYDATLLIFAPALIMRSIRHGNVTEI